jgi:hypothetical protein
MRLRSNPELQEAKDNLLPLTDQRRQQAPNKKSKRAAVSSDTDGKQLGPAKKKRRVVKGVKKEEEYPGKKEDDIEDEDAPVDSMKSPAALNKTLRTSTIWCNEPRRPSRVPGTRSKRPGRSWKGSVLAGLAIGPRTINKRRV